MPSPRDSAQELPCCSAHEIPKMERTGQAAASSESDVPGGTDTEGDPRLSATPGRPLHFTSRRFCAVESRTNHLQTMPFADSIQIRVVSWDMTPCPSSAGAAKLQRPRQGGSKGVAPPMTQPTQNVEEPVCGW